MAANGEGRKRFCPMRKRRRLAPGARVGSIRRRIRSGMAAPGPKKRQQRQRGAFASAAAAGRKKRKVSAEKMGGKAARRSNEGERSGRGRKGK